MSYYPTNQTEKQWQVIKNIVEPQERTRKKCLREILNAIFYISKSGCQWRMLPSDFPKWRTVHAYFAKWSEVDHNGISVLEYALKKSGWKGPRQTGAQRRNELFDR